MSDFAGGNGNSGSTYLNYRHLQDYYAAIDKGEFPVERGFVRDAVDLRLHTIFGNIQSMRIDRQSYLRRFGVDVYEEHEPAWQAVLNRGWCRITEAAIELLGDGVYYTPLIQALLSQRRLDQLTAASLVQLQ